jgi:serine/threonine protein kinase
MTQILSERYFYCFNPSCSEPQPQNDKQFCISCGSSLLLQERYHVVRLLGQGKFGRTFLASDCLSTCLSTCLSANTPLCVIKQLWCDLSSEEQASVELQKDIERLGRLGNHPQIPLLLESFQQDSCLYLVQEYIQGQDLGTILANQKRLTTQEVWQILESILPVLQSIHAHQIIHGDIKPENLIKPTSPEIQLPEQAYLNLALVDFSLPKLSNQTTQIQSDMPIGSAEYASPEQLQGNALFASDLYSLGVTCIHLLTGTHPFHLFDFINHKWTWRDYYLDVNLDARDEASDRQRNYLAQILDRLIDPDLTHRFPSADAAIAAMQRMGGKFRDQQKPASHTTATPAWDCAATLVGHTGLFATVNAVTFNSEGNILASGSDDTTVRLWDVLTGAELSVLRGHTHPVKTVLFHPHHPYILASAGSDRTIKLWDIRRNLEILSLTAHTHHVNALAFSPDGKILASGSADKTIKLWNPETGELVSTLTGHSLAVNAIAFCPISPILVSVSTDTTVKGWDLETLTVIKTLRQHVRPVKAISFCGDAKLLATGGEDRTIKLWDTEHWQVTQTLSGHSWDVAALAFSSEMEVLISGSWDKTVKLWQMETGKELRALKGHSDSITCVAISPGGSAIATGSKDRTIKIWTLI